jgi:hypothetical protein
LYDRDEASIMLCQHSPIPICPVELSHQSQRRRISPQKGCKNINSITNMNELYQMPAWNNNNTIRLIPDFILSDTSHPYSSKKLNFLAVPFQPFTIHSFNLSTCHDVHQPYLLFYTLSQKNWKKKRQKSKFYCHNRLMMITT